LDAPSVSYTSLVVFAYEKKRPLSGDSGRKKCRDPINAGPGCSRRVAFTCAFLVYVTNSSASFGNALVWSDPLPPDWFGVWVLIFSPVRAGALVGLTPGVCVTLVAVAVEVAVGDRLAVARGDAPVVGDETAGRVERGVVDGLDVDVLVGDGLGVDVAVGDGDGLGVGD